MLYPPYPQLILLELCFNSFSTEGVFMNFLKNSSTDSANPTPYIYRDAEKDRQRHRLLSKNDMEGRI